MKRQLFFTLLFLIFCLGSFSQNRFRPGIKAGLSTTQVEGDTYTGFNKVGIDGGIYLQAKLNEKWCAQFEFLFVQKGSKHNANPDAGDYNFYLMQLNYLEVPILAQYKIRNFTVELGPGFGYLISHREFDYWTELTNVEPFSPIELSGSIGISYTLGGRVGMNWRYTNSILPIRTFTNPTVAATYNPGQRNNVLAFTLFYTFGKSNEQ